MRITSFNSNSFRNNHCQIDIKEKKHLKNCIYSNEFALDTKIIKQQSKCLCVSCKMLTIGNFQKSLNAVFFSFKKSKVKALQDERCQFCCHIFELALEMKKKHFMIFFFLFHRIDDYGAFHVLMWFSRANFR